MGGRGGSSGIATGGKNGVQLYKFSDMTGSKQDLASVKRIIDETHRKIDQKIANTSGETKEQWQVAKMSFSMSTGFKEAKTFLQFNSESGGFFKYFSEAVSDRLFDTSVLKKKKRKR